MLFSALLPQINHSVFNLLRQVYLKNTTQLSLKDVSREYLVSYPNLVVNFKITTIWIWERKLHLLLVKLVLIINTTTGKLTFIRKP